MNSQFDEGADLMQQAIELEGAHVGEWHHNLASKYANAGICLYEGGRLDEARAMLLKAMASLERNAHMKDALTQVRETAMHYLQKVNDNVDVSTSPGHKLREREKSLKEKKEKKGKKAEQEQQRKNAEEL